MSIIYPVLAEASFNCEKSGRETFLPDVGHARARPFPATIQENQQPSEDTSAAKKAAAKTVGLWRAWGYFGNK